PSETTLFSGDRLSTGAQGWARVFLSQGQQIHLGAESAAQARRSGDDIAVELEKGRVTLQAHASNDIVVYSNGLEVGPTPTGRAVWEVTRLSATLTRVATYHGSVEVRALNRTLEVPAGRSLELETKLVPDGNNANDEEGSAGRAAVILLTLWQASSFPLPYRGGKVGWSAPPLSSNFLPISPGAEWLSPLGSFPQPAHRLPIASTASFKVESRRLSVHD
ncbi:MAG: FecR domain-containing protein, partial [Terriglobia bacterium]